MAVNLARSLRRLGYKVGLVDVDIHGPNVHVALKMKEFHPKVDSRARSIEPIVVDGVKVWTLAFILPKTQPVMFKGELKKRVVQQFLVSVNWGELDYLVADLPPGSSEEVSGAIEYLKPVGAVTVATPNDMALEDYFRIREMLRHFGIPELMTVLNMGLMVCPHCHRKVQVYGDAKLEGEVFRLPFDPKIAESKVIPRFDKVAQRVIERIKEVRAVPIAK